MAANPATVGLDPVSDTGSRRRKRPGVKPGGPNPGGFKPGHDPRRWLAGPRPSPVKQSFREKVQELSETAVEVLRDILEDPNAPIKERRGAAELVISHGYGTPVNRQIVATMDGSGGQAASLDLPALRQRAAALLEQMPAENKVIEHDVIDVEPAQNLHTNGSRPPG